MRSIKYRILLSAIAIATIGLPVFVGLQGCGESSGIPDVGGFRDVDVASLSEGTQPGDIALEIAGTDSGGKPFALSDYRGKVVMLSFWAEW